MPQLRPIAKELFAEINLYNKPRQISCPDLA